VFEKTEEEIFEKGGEIRQLTRNYRSAPDLLLWINEFMSSVNPVFAPMEPKEAPAPVSRNCATLIRAADPDQELTSIVARVHELIESGARLEQICVLGRTHKNLMDVARALKTHGYPTHVHSSRGFESRREVIDAVALWKFLLNPHDNLNLMILLRSPWFYV